jgi:hypothetical protein
MVPEMRLFDIVEKEREQDLKNCNVAQNLQRRVVTPNILAASTNR